MAIELTVDNFYLGFWHFEFPYAPPLTPSRGNVMGCAWRPMDKPSGPWTFRWRFRYYKDSKAFDSDDEKSWYESQLRSPDTDVLIRKKIGEAVAMWALVHKAEVNFYELMCEGLAAQEKMLASPPPFMDVRQESK